jgi:hypothetical protein
MAVPFPSFPYFLLIMSSLSVVYLLLLMFPPLTLLCHNILLYHNNVSTEVSLFGQYVVLLHSICDFSSTETDILA